MHLNVINTPLLKSGKTITQGDSRNRRSCPIPASVGASSDDSRPRGGGERQADSVMHSIPPGGVPVHRNRRRGRDGAHRPRHDRDAGPPADRLRPGIARHTAATWIRDIALSLGLPDGADAPRRQSRQDRRGRGGGEPVPPIAEVPADSAIEEADFEGRLIAWRNRVSFTATRGRQAGGGRYRGRPPA